jgi:hypothetical protein
METSWYTIVYSDLYYDITNTYPVTIQVGYNTPSNVINSIYPIGPYPTDSILSPTTNILATNTYTTRGGYSVTTNNVSIWDGDRSIYRTFSTPPSFNGSEGGVGFNTNVYWNGPKAINVIYSPTNTSSNFGLYTKSGENAAYVVTGGALTSINAGQTCFGHTTKILCINDNEEEIHTCVKDLKIGDIVKTYKHGNIPIKKIKKLLISNDNSLFTHNMYILRKTDENNLIEDLILSGGHSLLVDELPEEEDKKQKMIGFDYCIDDKKLMLAGLSYLFEPFLEEKNYLVYHFILENNGDKSKRYGVYANGILVETGNENNF